MLRLYNTLTRKVEEFKSINRNRVGIYSCGPTVYREVHIGNFRSYLMADILRRTLAYNGFTVRQVKNITDVGHMRAVGHGHHQKQIDPVISEALKEGKTPLEIAEKYTELFLEDEEKLNILPADVYPRATKHVEEMIEIIKTLLKKGYAYEVNGTIYFRVLKFKKYGRLSGNTLDKMDKLLEAVRVSVETDKKESADFALWKKAEPGRVMSWESPWGRGFPGWHIECSAMSMKYLSEAFENGNFRGEQSRTIDLHTGGEDNIFPHHEDEIAQSESATGHPVVNYWVHGGYLLVDGEKMSRSKGNVYTISDLERRGFDPLSFRYLTFMTHYRARMNFTWEALEGAQTALNRLREEIASWEAPKIGCAEYEQKFLQALDDNLNLPQALSIVWDLVRSNYPTSAKAESLFKMDEVLGLDLRVKDKGGRGKESEIPEEVMKLVRERDELRRQKRYHLADQLRNKIKKLGYEVEDTNGKSKIIVLRGLFQEN